MFNIVLETPDLNLVSFATVHMCLANLINTAVWVCMLLFDLRFVLVCIRNKVFETTQCTANTEVVCSYFKHLYHIH